jgi:hypothetical protein
LITHPCWLVRSAVTDILTLIIHVIRWEDAVQKDALQILGTRGWRKRAENREEWGQLWREAKARKGL